jgi:hypothetical protein
MNMLPIAGPPAGVPGDVPAIEPGDGFAEAMAVALGLVPPPPAAATLPTATALPTAPLAVTTPSTAAALPTGTGSSSPAGSVVPAATAPASLGDAVAGLVVPFIREAAPAAAGADPVGNPGPGTSPVAVVPEDGESGGSPAATAVPTEATLAHPGGHPSTGSGPGEQSAIPAVPTTAAATTEDAGEETVPGTTGEVPAPASEAAVAPRPHQPGVATPATDSSTTGPLTAGLPVMPRRAPDIERIERSAPRLPDAVDQTSPEGSVDSPVATAAGTEPASSAPAGGTSAALLHRIEETIRRLEQGPPPRAITLDLEELGVGRLIVSVQSDGIRLAAADGSVIPASLLAELENALAGRGFDLAGDERGRSGDDERDESGGWHPRSGAARRRDDDTSIRL